MEKKMETTVVYWGSIGKTEKKMETSVPKHQQAVPLSGAGAAYSACRCLSHGNVLKNGLHAYFLKSSSSGFQVQATWSA